MVGTHSDTLIAVPNMGWLRTELVPTLSSYANQGASIFTPIGLKPTARARNECVVKLLDMNLEWLWFIDHDTLPQPGALELLKDSGDVVVSGLVCALKRDTDGMMKPVPMVLRHSPEGLRPVLEGTGVEPIDRCGSACVVIHRSVFEKVGTPWYEERSWETEIGPPCGQDFVFCEKVEALGIPMHANFNVRGAHKKEVDL